MAEFDTEEGGKITISRGERARRTQEAQALEEDIARRLAEAIDLKRREGGVAPPPVDESVKGLVRQSDHQLEAQRAIDISSALKQEMRKYAED